MAPVSLMRTFGTDIQATVPNLALFHGRARSPLTLQREELVIAQMSRWPIHAGGRINSELYSSFNHYLVSQWTRSEMVRSCDYLFSCHYANWHISKIEYASDFLTYKMSWGETKARSKQRSIFCFVRPFF